jgi:hypothetical protein
MEDTLEPKSAFVNEIEDNSIKRVDNTEKTIFFRSNNPAEEA